MSKIILYENASGEDLSYYRMLRDTIHGLDNVIVTVIAQSFTILTGIITLSILLYEKIDDRFSATILALFLIIISFFDWYISLLIDLTQIGACLTLS